MYKCIIIISLSLIYAVLSSEISGTNAFCTYHLYTKTTSLTTVSCSDGQNGLITRFHYNDLSKMFPYVAAWDKISWNSPNCGSCIKLTDNRQPRKSIYITTIDMCGGGMGGGDTHFDISQEAFTELFGSDGVRDGHGYATWEVVPGKNCKGNLGKSHDTLFLEDK